MAQNVASTDLRCVAYKRCRKLYLKQVIYRRTCKSCFPLLRKSLVAHSVINRASLATIRVSFGGFL